MAHSYRVHFFHIIFSTKGRRPQIKPDIQSELYPYMSGIVKNHKGKVLAIGGLADHVHLLVELSNIDKFSDFIREVKASSSLWIHKTYPCLHDFAWQEGYGSYTVSYSGLDAVQKYIFEQDKHHDAMTFDEEYIKFLNVHQVAYDERFVLG